MSTTAPTAFERRIVRRGLGVLAMAVRTMPVPFAIAVAGSTLYATATVGSAVALGWVTDTVIEPAYRDGDIATATLGLAAAVIVGIAVANALGIVVRRTAAYWMQYGLHAHFRRRVAERLTRLPLSWHRRRSTGELLSAANADVEATFWPVAPLPLTVGVLVMLVLAGGVLIATDLWLALVGLLLIPALIAVNLSYNAAVRRPATRAQQGRAEVAEVAHESFDGALVVKTLGREDEETARFEASSQRLRDDLIAVGRVRAVFEPVMEALPSLAILAILLVGAGRVAAGAVSTGDIVRIGYLFVLLEFPLRALGFILMELPRSVVGWERVERVLRARPDAPQGLAEPPSPEGPAAVDLAEVSFGYDDEGASALEAITASVTPGRTIAVVGATGSGKSTLASLLVGLAAPSDGQVALDGHDLRGLAPTAITAQAAIVFQHSFLFDASVRENITLGASFSKEQVRAAAALARADDFVAALPEGYDTVVGERGATLSGGQRQRVALARALVRRPRLLVLDDATSSVDPSVEREILEGLREAALPSTVVIVAYRRATIELADEVVVLDEGRLADRGTHAELLARQPAYAELVTAYERAR